MENAIKMDDLGVPPFSETPISEIHQEIFEGFAVCIGVIVVDPGSKDIQQSAMMSSWTTRSCSKNT